MRVFLNRCQSVQGAGKSRRLSTLGSAWNSVNDTCAVALGDATTSLSLLCETPPPLAGVSLHSDPGDISSSEAANVAERQTAFRWFYIIFSCLFSGGVMGRRGGGGIASVD